MAVGAPLPDRDRVARGCSEGYDGNEVTADAFALRPGELKYGRISVDWVECPYVDHPQQSLEGSARRFKKRMAIIL